MIKRVIAFAVLGVSLTFAGLLILGKNFNPHTIKTENPPQITAGANKNTLAPAIINQSGSNNITQDLVEKISEEIAAQNKISGLKEGLNVLKPEELVEQYIAEGNKNFNYQSLKPVIKQENLKIISNNSSQVIQNYIEQLKNILKDNFGGTAIKLNDPSADEWEILEKAYSRTVDQLYNLPVPANLASAHTKEIVLISAQAKIYQYLRNYKSDPFKALLAISASRQIDQEFAAVTKEINSKAVNL